MTKQPPRSWFWTPSVEQEVDEELAFHLEMHVRDLVASGMSPDAAREKAQDRLGDLYWLRRNCVSLGRKRNRMMHITQWAGDVRDDVVVAIRRLKQSPGFTFVAVLTLALGIGANTAMFSLIDSVIVRKLPFNDPDRLVMVWEDATLANGFARNEPGPGDYTDWRKLNRSFTDLAATAGASASLTGDGPPEQVLGARATAGFFPVLGVQPQLGRGFTEDEDRNGAPVVVISHALWQRRYGGETSVIGRRVLMNDSSAEIIGVMPKSFVFRNREIGYWVPIHFTPAQATLRGFHFLNVVARLKPGVSATAAAADMSAIATALQKLYPDTNDRRGAVVVPLKEDLIGNTRLELIVLMAAAASTLLIACANLASLLLSRSAGRRSELAVRVALGATRGRLVHQMVIEGMTLALLGGLLGLALPPLADPLLERLVPTGVPTVTTSALDWRLIGFSFLASLVTGLLFSIVPALQAARASLRDALQRGARASVGGSSGATRDALVVLQVAATLVLLVTAGLMLRTLANLRAIDIGFRSDRLLTMRTTLPQPKYADPLRRMDFYERVLRGVRELPGVQHAAYVNTLPFASTGNIRAFAIEGRTMPPGQLPTVLYRVGTNDYLQTLDARLADGRLLDDRDVDGATRTVVINETMAGQFWPNESALGRRIRLGPPSAPWITVVGVVKDVHERGYELAMKPGVYLSASQMREGPDNLLVRVTGDPLQYATQVQRIIASVDPTQPVAAVRTLNDIIDLNVGERHQQMVLLVAFGGLALLLVSLGLYGLLAQTVSARSREIGLRIALGASPGRVMTTVIARGVVLTALGVVAGGAAAWAVTRTMSSLLYGVGAADPMTFAGVGALLGIVALSACALPALRAARVDPMVALREQST
jgi:putative ABC transport system permease protein